MRLRRIEPVLRRALSGPCALPRGTRVLVAISGGADSTALLLALHRVAPEFGLLVHAAHLNHGLRGPEAEADARFVSDFCASLAIPLESGRRDARALLVARGLSGQDGLRTIRREFLASAARRAHCTAIATAHTADDQLETLLMRLGRGASLAGIAGIAPRRGRWIRPLLAATRAEVEADLKAARVEWREDASNRDRAYARNRVRHDAVPALIGALGGPGGSSPTAARAGLARRVAAALSDLGEVSRWLDARARRILRGLALIESGVIVLPVVPIRGLPRALRLAVLRQAWRAVGREGLLRAHVESLDRALGSTAPRGPIRLPGGVVASTRRGELRLERAAEQASGTRASAAGSRGSAAGSDARCGRGGRWGRVTPRRIR